MSDPRDPRLFKPAIRSIRVASYRPIRAIRVAFILAIRAIRVSSHE
jgi:hypothetical protein